MNKPKVTILALGGTIAMTKSEQGGVVPTLTGEKLVAAVPGLDTLAEIDAQSFRQLPGAHLGFDDLEALADHIRTLCTQSRRGIVITQGTDTIEETAFALDRLLDVDVPVIVTGAMRNPTVAGADGPANLLAAVQVAISDEARGKGCLVVLNDEVHAARFVRKMHTSSPNAFGSPTSGRIGWVSEGLAFFCFALEKLPILPTSTEKQNARVALATVALGDDGEQVKALASARFDGMVVNATGGGHVPPAVADALESAAKHMPVVLASRTGAGNTLGQTYGFPGSEIDLQRRGLIRAGWLDGLKAKVLLTLLLRHGVTGHDAIEQAFQTWSGGKP
ncbi:asparaginase [Allopusillimonas ginsengisoli]|nr:asparaginase [Allopusillimonas ginsengisoli]